MPDNLVEDLKRYKDWFRLADDNFDEKQDEYYLAVGLDRQPLYPHTMGHWLTKLETKHGFKHVSCHGLRHTYCSLLLLFCVLKYFHRNALNGYFIKIHIFHFVVFRV